MSELRPPTGIRDVVAPESARWAALVAMFHQHFSAAGYQLVLPPLVEHVEVFQRVGDSTDIVRKEMYDFEDKGGERLALRPEITAGLMRVFANHRPTTPWKVITFGPNYRHEKPQANRYRQHHQLDAEIVGSADPQVDVEVVGLLDRFYRALGLSRFTLQITSLGDHRCRPAYLADLVDTLQGRTTELSEQSRHTLALNPLRVLDSKRPEDQPVIDDAPKMLDHLCSDCSEHFAAVRAGLDALGVTYEVTPRLVRGLDYYTRTTFEFASHALDSAQNAIGGGGRYDGLVEQLGGPPGTSGIGFGSGIERLLAACDAEGVFPTPVPALDVFVVDTTGGAQATSLAFELRAAGIACDRAFDGRSMKSQMKAADRAGARVALIVGSDELAAGTVTVRDLRSSTQDVVERAEVVAAVKRMLA